MSNKKFATKLSSRTQSALIWTLSAIVVALLLGACSGLPTPPGSEEGEPTEVPVVKADTRVVVEGRLENVGLFRGEKVLTRCASKYESKRPAAPGQRGARTGEGDGG